MKVPIDQKFLASTTITLFVLLLVVVILNMLAGTAVAITVGSVLGGIAVKLSDKLDYSPTSHFEIRSESSYILSSLSGIFILYGCTIFAKMWKDICLITYGEDYIFNSVVILIGIVFDWGGFIIGGWLIGRIFSNNAIRVTAVAGFFLVIALTVHGLTGEHIEKMKHLLNYLIRHDIISESVTNESFWEGTIFGSKVGAFFGGIIRTYIAIVMARISSRKYLDKQIQTT
jgi:hypothetical protein